MTIDENNSQGFDVTLEPQSPNIPLIKTVDQIFTSIKYLNSHATSRKEVLTFQNVKNYFKTQTPKVFGIKKAAIYKEKHPQGYMIGLFFINSHDEIATDEKGEAYGRIILANSLDEDLKKILSDTNFVILK
ncbi:hypothetical protein H6G81_28050 [Scytonema hofmannii FACHB-248]|uniref:Uncharacterized protein n=1 Tax=Scytonema hofmannii FACHB-248 TaxID=1842502 RepID=A0ABR8GZQ2_9CYAN|nr:MULTISPECIES: hypothetical protein [Nostocales]MBD2608263.1 hypothetical protein [Scytonema hofmannii FACHB-248]